MSLKVKFFAGWIKTEAMENNGWFNVWWHTAKKAEDEKKELVVFRIPKNKIGLSNEVIEDIEKLLQERFPEFSNPQTNQSKN